MMKLSLNKDFYGKKSITFSRILMYCITLGLGARPLHYAAFGCHVKCVEFLLEFGASVNAIDTLGQSPLVMAVLAGSIEICTLLISRDAG